MDYQVEQTKEALYTFLSAPSIKNILGINIKHKHYSTKSSQRNRPYSKFINKDNLS